MFINWARQEINLKIVYYGPGLSGKTTNLYYVHQKLSPESRGELITLKTKEDRTLFFDFMQLDIGAIKNKRPKFNLYTIPGQSYYAESRKIILSGADGVVFVADSHPQRLVRNIDSLKDLRDNLQTQGRTLEKFPWVIQYNKRDLENAVAIDILEYHLNPYHVPYFEAVASTGKGVFITLKTILSSVVSYIQKQL